MRARKIKNEIKESEKSLAILTKKLKELKPPDIQKYIQRSKILDEFLEDEGSK